MWLEKQDCRKVALILMEHLNFLALVLGNQVECFTMFYLKRLHPQRYMDNPKSTTSIPVLNHGFVSLMTQNTKDWGDLLIVNAARVSFGKSHDALDDSDSKLINYLVKNKHDSPLRHVQVSFRIKAPEFVMRQWYKHIVGIAYTPAREPDHAWNEISGRYVEYQEEFYYPNMRKQSQSNKQATLNEEVCESLMAQELYRGATDNAYNTYKDLLKLGVGREVARTILPLNFYTEVIWTASLQAILNFITLREHPHAQWEIQEYAQAVKTLVRDIAPIALQAWEMYRL